MTEETNILVVDDERSIRRTLGGLLKHYYNVTTVENGEQALSLVSETPFDLVLLDINLPGIDGITVLDSLKRQQPDLVVIMLTGHASVDSAVHTLRGGAVDYLQKPASNQKILESVKGGLERARRERQRNAMLIKAQEFFQAGLEKLNAVTPEQVDLVSESESEGDSADPDRFLHRGELTIDLYRRMATLKGELLELTAGEYDLLLALAQHAPRVLSPQELVRQTRGFECSLQEAREIIRWQVYLLRQKIEVDSSAPEYILNVRGRGYMWAGA